MAGERRPEFPFFGPLTLTFSGGQELIRGVSLDVPVNSPLGDYIVSLEARSRASEVLDEDSFRVTVVGSEEASMGPGTLARGEFIVRGW